jgi:hypothetical protein
VKPEITDMDTVLAYSEMQCNEWNQIVMDKQSMDKESNNKQSN